MSVILPIVDLWPSELCCIRLGAIRCPLSMVSMPSMVLYLCRMCQCMLPKLYISYKFISTRHDTKYIYFTLGIIHKSIGVARNVGPWKLIRLPFLMTLNVIVRDWRVSRVGPMLIYWPASFISTSYFLSSTVFPFLFFLSIGWYCGAGVVRLIGCKSLSSDLALPTSFNNNTNINNNCTRSSH